MPVVLPYAWHPERPLLRLSASPMLVPASWAEDAARRSYQVPAGSLGAALTRFTGLVGVDLGKRRSTLTLPEGV